MKTMLPTSTSESDLDRTNTVINRKLLTIPDKRGADIYPYFKRSRGFHLPEGFHPGDHHDKEISNYKCDGGDYFHCGDQLKTGLT